MPLLEPLLNYVSSTTLITTFVVVYISLFTFSIFYSRRPKPGKNPFVPPNFLGCFSLGPTPPVTTSKERDAVLKQTFSGSRLPQKIDVVVVDSGIGGLSTATLLARAGKRVVVLEPRDQAGGSCHSFREKGFEFDVGIHYVGDMNPGSVTRVLVDQLTDGHLDWVEMDPDYDVVHLGPPENGRRFAFTKNKKVLMERLVKEFPEEQVAIDKFFTIVTKIHSHYSHMVYIKVLPLFLARWIIATGLLPRVSNYFYYAQFSLQDILDQVTTNPDLKGLLAYSFKDCGTLPEEAPVTTHALTLSQHAKGAFYPRGGASQIALHMIPVIEKAGGRVLVGANVTELVVNEKGSVVGVRVDKGGGVVQEVRAATVISAAGIPRTAQLLPAEQLAASNLCKIYKQVDAGPGVVSLFVGLAIDQEVLSSRGIRAQNTWSFARPDVGAVTRQFLALEAAEAARAPVPLLFASFPSSKDPSWSSRYPGKSTLTVATVVSSRWFEQGKDYEAAFMRNMFERTRQLFPQLEGVDVPHMQLGSSPSSSGLDHSMSRSSPEVAMYSRPDVGLPGLLISGEDVLCCGFTGGLFAGVLCASQYLNRNLMTDLEAVQKLANAKDKNM